MNASAHEAQTTKTVVIYLCPVPECSNYYAASSAGDLSAEPQSLTRAADYGQPLHFRDECPDCKLRDVVTHRRPVTLAVAVPLDASRDADSITHLHA